MAGQTYFITGANRGIGLEITKHLIASNPDNKVVATVRDISKAGALKELGKNVLVFPLDLNSEKSIDAIESELEKINVEVIDVFVSNAAISDSFVTVLECQKDVWLDHYQTNVLAPILIFQKVYKALAKSKVKKVAFISSGAGSLTGYFATPISAYGQSKAALNYTVIELSHELKSEGFTVVAIHPGIVSTDMGAYGYDKIKANSPHIVEAVSGSILTPEQSGALVGKVIETLSEEDNGKFLNFDHTETPY